MRSSDKKFIEVNEAFVRWLGLDRNRILGRDSVELGMWVNLEDRAKFWADLERSNGSLRDIEVQTRTKRGTVHTLLASAESIEINREPHVFIFALDITERKRAEVELLRALAREKELGQLRSNFVSMVSHEFRTPLGIIQSSAEILRDYLGQLKPTERTDHLQSICNNTRRMAGLMEEAPLVRAVLLHEANQAVIILVAHHSIADGLSIAFVIRDLLQALSGHPIDLLPVLPAHEEILGVTRSDAAQAEPSKESNSTPPARPAIYLRKEDSRPRIKGLRLSSELTGKLRERARQEGTTVHGALSSAFALAYWQTSHESREEPIRICSPIDTRKLLGLGQDCAVLFDAAVVAIEPHASSAFWDIARHSIAGLAGAQTLNGISASRNVLHQVQMEMSAKVSDKIAGRFRRSLNSR